MKRYLLLTALLLVVTFKCTLSAQDRRLDTTTFVVLGEGLAAGMGNFSLNRTVQEGSFPALVADRLGTIFPQPLLQPPGVGTAVGFQELPVRLPGSLQSTVREPFPPSLFVFNLSVPGFRLRDALTMRPLTPLIQEGAKQTLVNLILGYPAMILEDEVPLWNQVEYAESMRPTLALVELGFYDVLEAAVNGDLSLLPSPTAFGSDYQEVISRLRSIHAQVVVATIPDPLSTAFFTDPLEAAELLKVPPFVLLGLYGFDQADQITVTGLAEIGHQFVARTVAPLPSGSFLPADAADEISFAVQALNSEIRAVAQAEGAVVFDLHGLYQQIEQSGVAIEERHLTASYLGGIYSLNGYYPGVTGHAVIANGLLSLLNQTYNRSFDLVDVNAIAESDPVADFRPAQGRSFNIAELATFVPPERLQVIQQLEEEWEQKQELTKLPPSFPDARGKGKVGVRP